MDSKLHSDSEEHQGCSVHEEHDHEVHSNLKDPVCGMDVTPQSEHSVEQDGNTYYFCSAHCVHKFNENPQQYLNPELSKDEATGYCADGSCDIGSVFYTCPMHPEIQQNGPGSCPKCGMALESAGEPVPTTRTQYTCPMHPEILQD